MSELKHQAIRGGVAKVLAQTVSFVLRMGALMILARLLGPTDFGLVGMVTAVTGVLSLFKEFGLSVASVQRENITDPEISTLFWINLLVGVSLGLIAVAVSPLVVAFYDEPRLSTITIALASGFVFNAAGVQHSAVLQRRLQFTSLAIIDVASLLISSVVSITLAVRGYGYWALVAWSISTPLCATVMAWLKTRWLPGRPRFEGRVLAMLRFGTTVTLNGVVVYIAYNLDKVLLGRFFGAEITGIYGRAFQLITLPTENLNTAVGTVVFPVLARVQHEPERLRTYFLKAYSLVLAVTIPISIVCALFASELIHILLGPQWKDAVPIFRLLIPTITIFALINPTGWLLVALGMVGRSLKIALVIAPVVITGYVVGLPYGPRGVACGYSAAMTLWLIPHLIWCFRGTVVSYRDVLGVVMKPVVSGIIAAFAVYALIALVGPKMGPLARVVVGGGVLLSFYAWTLLFVMQQRSLYVEVFRGLKHRSIDQVAVSG
jgi:PST family polysaccharide transporter